MPTEAIWKSSAQKPCLFSPTNTWKYVLLGNAPVLTPVSGPCSPTSLSKAATLGAYFSTSYTPALENLTTL